jgi:hypothetical protein
MRSHLSLAVTLAALLLAAGCTSKGNPCAPADAGAADAGPQDGGADAGSADAGADAGLADAGVVDAGPADAGGADAGASDAGASDAGASDAGADAGSSTALPSGGCTDGETSTAPSLALSFNFNGHTPFVAGGSFAWGDAGNCNELVRSFGAALTTAGDAGPVPFPLSTDGGPVALGIILATPFNGPGTYGATAAQMVFGADGGDAGFAVYQPTLIGSDTAVQFNGDLSGTITVTDWGDTTNNIENGTLSWTCTP